MCLPPPIRAERRPFPPLVSASPCIGGFFQRVKDLSTEIREFVAIQNAQVVPVSARTGSGLNGLRTSLAAALSQHPSPSERPPSNGSPECSGSETRDQGPPALECPAGSRWASAATDTSGNRGSTTVGSDDDIRGAEVVVAEAPEDAATATVLDYSSSAKTGKVLVSFLGLVIAARCCCPHFCCCRRFCRFCWSVAGICIVVCRPPSLDPTRRCQ